MSKIPKIIWQTHEWDYASLPEMYLKTSNTWRLFNQDWEYKYVSGKERKEQVAEEFPEFIDLYNQYHKLNDLIEKNLAMGIKQNSLLPGMAQADLWRFLVLHKYGGVYADMDSICIGSLDEMLRVYSDKELVVANPIPWGNDAHSIVYLNNLDHNTKPQWHINTANFATTKNNKVLSIIVEKLRTVTYNVDIHRFFSICAEHPDITAYDFRWAVHSDEFKHDGHVYKFYNRES